MITTRLLVSILLQYETIAAPPEKIRQLEANELEEISISREHIAKTDPLWCF